jgi:hypothetical protein
MARIRSLKPEHKRHRKIGPLTDRQYRLWVGMLTEADDEGRLVVDVAQLRLEVFGYHPRVKIEHVAEALQAIVASGLVTMYEVEGTHYVQFPSWKDHQVISHPSPSKCPSPLHSLNGHGTLPESSGTFLPDLIGSDRKGSDRRGSEGAGMLPPPTTPPRIEFKTPKPVLEALDRCLKLGAVRRLRDPTWWQAELRANPRVDLTREVFKAEAYLVAHPEKHYKRLDTFLHGWLGRADRESP